MVSETAIEQTILQAIANANLARPGDQQLDASPDAILFGPGSSLDSLGLVALLIDIEDSLRDVGVSVTLSDERAVSQRSSPFRSVPALRSYIVSLLQSA